MRRLLIITMMALTAMVATPLAAQTDEKTRLLLIVDCSASMWDQWQSAPKVKVMQRVLLSFLDSVAADEDVEVALRVFGHLNRQHFGTRLEVPFEVGNLYRLQSKIKTLVPNGGCTVEAALTDALSDFPAVGSGRNIILIVTDGMDDRDAEICEVARQVQLSGVVAQTFVVCIGGAQGMRGGCAGGLYTVAHEDDFGRVLHGILRQSGGEARVVLRLLDAMGSLYETEHPVALYDHATGILRHSTIYAIDDRLVADTMRLDPLTTYDITVFTHPPIRREAVRFAHDEVNVVEMTANEGTLRAVYGGARQTWQQGGVDVVVRRAGSGDRIAAQAMDEEGSYLAGRYDIEVQTLPVMTMRGVEVRGGASTVVEVPTPGQLILAKPRGITTGAIFRILEGRAEFATDLNPSTAGERLLLQPGQYEVVVKPQESTVYTAVQTRRFVIESGQVTKIQF